MVILSTSIRYNLKNIFTFFEVGTYKRYLPILHIYILNNILFTMTVYTTYDNSQ